METEQLKKYAPWIVGGLVGLYVVSKFMGGGTAPTNSSSGLSSLLAQQAQVAAQNSQYQLQASQLAMQGSLQAAQIQAQQAAQDQAATIAYNNSLGNVAQSAGQSIAQVIAAQSMLPADAINQVVASNQTTLSAAAAASMQATAALPGALQGAAQVVQASYTPEIAYGATVQGLGASLANAGTGAVNAVATASNSANASNAQIATANANANAQNNLANKQMVTTLGSAALLAFA